MPKTTVDIIDDFSYCNKCETNHNISIEYQKDNISWYSEKEVKKILKTIKEDYCMVYLDIDKIMKKIEN